MKSTLIQAKTQLKFWGIMKHEESDSDHNLGLLWSGNAGFVRSKL